MPTSIPKFTDQGLLPAGIHLCSASEFIKRFYIGENREDFSKAVIDILDFAAARNVRYVFVGGSFVTDRADPRDIDVVMVPIAGCFEDPQDAFRVGSYVKGSPRVRLLKRAERMGFPMSRGHTLVAESHALTRYSTAKT